MSASPQGDNVSEYSNPELSDEPAISRFKAALFGRGASGTLLWFAMLTVIIIALTLVANRCDNDGDTEADTTDDTDATADEDAPAPDTPESDTAADENNDDDDDNDSADQATPTPPAATTVAAAEALVDGGTATLRGIVTDRATADGLVAAVEQVLGQGAAIDELDIDPEASTESATLSLSGSVEEQTAAQLAAALTDAYGDVAYDDAGAVIVASVDVVAELNALFVASPVQFALGSAEILDESVPILDQVAEALGEAPGLALEIQGHTDATGSEDANLTLSLLRADAVLAYLVNAGVDTARLSAAGFGSSIPIADNDTPEGQQANRRIAIVTG